MTQKKPSYVYVTYLSTTAEKVWQAITDPEMTKQYWMDPGSDKPAHVNVSDWQPGSRWEHQRDDATRTVDVVGTVISTTPHSQLVLSWARPAEVDDPAKHSRVTFDIDVINPQLVRLTVIHDDLDHDPKMLAGISQGWPMVLSNLKTLLETGKAL